jgi:hypothetical protein
MKLGVFTVRFGDRPLAGLLWTALWRPIWTPAGRGD